MSFKSFFDIPPSIVYLNTPGNGMLPRKHLQWRRQREIDFFNPAGKLRDQQNEFIQQVRMSVSALFKSKFENTYLTPNFSFGFSTLLNGLEPHSKFLLIKDDYPSVNFPILNRGFPCILVESGAELEKTIREAVQMHKPNVLAFSVVNYITGLKIDLDFIKKLKRDFPGLLILGDATQYLGTEPFDFSNSGFDAIGFSGYKWMISGFGNGVFFLSDSLKEQLYAEAQKRSRPKEAMWSSKSIIDTYFEPGHQDTLSHGTLGQSILFFEEHGLESVASHIRSVLAYAYERLEEKNLLLPEISKRNLSLRSSLINVQIPVSSYPALFEAGIMCYPRGNGIRIGVHLYNEKSDIDYLMDQLKNLPNL